MKTDQVPVTVRILDKEYLIACESEEQDGLLSSARLLDRRMREVRQSGRVVGSDRIAVLAALNLTYELMSQNLAQQKRANGILDRLRKLEQRIDQLLSGEPHLDAGRKLV
jgi:cell division protein ZapA